MGFTEKDNKSYWEQRAREHSGSWKAGSNDELLMRLEVEMLARCLKKFNGKAVLDVGCGNGATIKALIKKDVRCHFTGMDLSPSMVKSGQKTTKHQYVVGDVSKFDLNKLFDAVYSVRCLINLETTQKQKDALQCIARHLAPKGLYYCLEPFREGLKTINALRRDYRLSMITMPWHNNYMRMEVIEASKSMFEVVRIEHFASTYYLASRLFNALAARQVKRDPQYRDPINLASLKLPVFGEYAPHRLVVLRKKG